MGKAADIILKCLQTRGMSQRKLSQKMKATPQNINQQILGDDLKMERFTEILDYIGYRISIEDINNVFRVHPEDFEALKDQKERMLIWCENDGIFQSLVCDGINTEIKFFNDKNDCVDYLIAKKDEL